MPTLEPTNPEELVDDPIYVNTLREACFILCLWAVCFVYTVSYCYLNGYLSHEPLASSTGPDVATLFGPLTQFNRDPDSLTYPLGLGIPDWVFYGIVLPWIGTGIVIVWYCLFYFTEDDLSAEDEQEES